jgi:thiamine pyrophosphokinase
LQVDPRGFFTSVFVLVHHAMKFTPDVVIALNGDVPEPSFFNRMTIPLICADGAVWKFIDRFKKPSTIVGDLDSFFESEHSRQFKLFFPNTELVKISDQDTNDFEKSLKLVIERGYQNILVCGFNGGDTEHTLNNWSVFARYTNLVNLALYDKGRIAVSVKDTIEFSSYPREIVSIIPQPNAVITTTGLEWELNKEELRFGMREGARNRAKASQVTIQIHEGNAIVFVESIGRLEPR